MWRCALLLAAACGRIDFASQRVACPPSYVDTATGCYRASLDVIELSCPTPRRSASPMEDISP